MTPVPKLSAEQRRAALQKAASARRVRAAVKQGLRASTLSLADVIARARAEESVAQLKVIDLLTAMPGIGVVKARRIMERVGIAETRRVRGLGVHQVTGLLDEFDRRG